MGCGCNCQTWASSLLLVGFLSCLLGAVSPFWREGRLLTNSTGFLHGDSALSDVMQQVDYHGGLFYYCVQLSDGGTECNVFDMDNGDAMETGILWLCMVQVGLGLLSLVTALCCMCYGSDPQRWYRCQGVFSCFVGFLGIIVTIMYSVTPDNVWGMTLVQNSAHHYWSMFVYMSGSAVVLLVAMSLLISAPGGVMPCLSKRKGYEDPNEMSTK